MVEEPVVDSNHNDILKSGKPFSAHPIKFYRMKWFMIIQCEGKYPTVQLKPFLVEAEQKGIFFIKKTYSFIK